MLSWGDVWKSKFGARALGNRSILANPCNLELKQIINDKIKSRDFGCLCCNSFKKIGRYYKNQILSTYKYADKVKKLVNAQSYLNSNTSD